MTHEFDSVNWLGFYCEIPCDWEISRHGIKDTVGSLSFIDKYQQRMQFGWTLCTSRPDVKRIFDDFIARDKVAHPDCIVQPFFKIKQWQVYRRLVGQTVMSRGGMYDSNSKYWLDCIIMWPKGVDETLERKLFEKSMVSLPDASTKVIRAFHCDLKISARWKLNATIIKPADSTFTFASLNDTCTIRRIGMTDAWFTGDCKAFLVKELGQIRGTFSTGRFGNHEGVFFVGKDRVFHPRWLLGHRRIRKDQVVYCAIEKALYHVSSLTYPKRQFENSEIRLTCCKGI
jgi:hypothetical protein